MTAAAPEISLVLPCYNESENIVGVLRESVAALEKTGRTWELLVVDNHSGDGTAERVRQLQAGEPRLRLVVHDANRFYSGSCRTALAEARGRLVAIMDSDGQFTARDLPLFLEALDRGANLVFGWRRARRDPASRKFLSWVFNALARNYLGFALHDLNVGLRMFDRDFIRVAEVRHALNMANPELYVRARLAGLRVEEVPVSHFARERGRSSHDFRKLWRLLWTVVGYFRSLGRELRSRELSATSRR
jgi:glycosyltransferase involved in cell wall biosynthesis